MKGSTQPGRTRAVRAATPLPLPGTDWAYFFDIDGTLIDFTASPDTVLPDRDIRQMIEGLYRSAGGAVALISGRALADIDRLFPGTRLPAAGQHGIERRDATGRVSLHAFPSERLEAEHRRLAAAIARYPELMLEHKGLSLALHYRRAPRLGGFAHRLLRGLQSRIGEEYCLQAGKCVVEVKPAGRDKGVAVMEFMQEAPFRGRMPVFLGDDVTDEFGFATVNQLSGHSVKVGPGPTVARWRLRNVRAVRAWLERGVATPRGDRA